MRVSELTGLNVDDVDRKEQMLRVLGKGNKERIIPYGSKAEQALEAYWPMRAELLARAGRDGEAQAVFLNHSGQRLTSRSVARIVKKYVRLGEYQLGPAPALAAARLCHALARRRRRPARHPGTAGP